MNAAPLRVPCLAPAVVEQAACDLLAAYEAAIGRPAEPPIPIELIIEQHLKLDFAIADLAEKLGRDDVLGATWFEKGMIRMDRRLEGHEGRISFTMAHEVGHWVLLSRFLVPTTRRKRILVA